jgi:Holliday junction resolvasome RuvABC DNA-binding subunit
MMAQELNNEIATRLEEVGRLLAGQGANQFRVRAYRGAARTLRTLPRSVADIVHEEGVEGLRRLPGIGVSLARAIHQLVTNGRWGMLNRLRGESNPVALLATVPGIGRELADRIHADLGIDSLEELEAAANDGRLADIEAIGEKRLAGIRDSLSARLGRVRDRAEPFLIEEPSVAEVLDVDHEYRSKVAQNALPRIAPRRFNPAGETWLPVLHTQRGARYYTALFSNTALAHRQNRTHDWLILYYDAGSGERQCTVVTAQNGPLSGKRIVRGRETECAEYYRCLLQRPA